MRMKWTKRGRIESYRLRLLCIVVGICCVIALAIVGVMAKSPSASQRTSRVSSQKPVPSCDRRCQDNFNPWVTVKSEAPADVMAAAKQTDMYQRYVSIANSSPVQGQVSQVEIDNAAPFKQGLMDTPRLVKPYRDDVVNLPTCWVIPLLNNAHRTAAMLTFVYDATNHRLRAEGTGSGDIPGSLHHAFPAVSQAEAITLVHQTKHLSVVLNGSKAPVLIYFPWSPYAMPLSGTLRWKEGGTEYADPIWRIVTTDGHYYYVDHLGKEVYTGKSLPVDSSFPPAL